MYPYLTIQELLDVAASIVVVLDKQGIVRLVNKKGCEILGYNKDEIEGRNWFRHCIPHEHSLDKLRRFKEFIRCGCPNEFEETYVLTKSGDSRLISWSKASMKDKEGNIVAMLRSGEDITEKKVLQERLANQEREKRKQMIAAILEAQEKERLHIASELHDNVGQILTTSKLLLEGELCKEDVPQSLNHAYEYLQNAIDELRSISHQLNPAQLKEIGLLNSIKELVKTINNASQVRATIRVEKANFFDDLDSGISLSLFRIVQEQLSNIIKHANATLIIISLSRSVNAVELEITDNGRGFKLTNVNKGLGLKNIYNRAELFNGRVIINTAPDEGCIISVYIPLL